MRGGSDVAAGGPMILTFCPIRMDAALAVAVRGETLVLNGVVHDLSGIAEGAAAAVGSPWLAGPVCRVAGVLQVALILPHGPDAPPAVRFPAPVAVTADGPVTLPGG